MDHSDFFLFKGKNISEHGRMDRTNWQFGKKGINILVLSAVYKGVGLPLFWKVLSKKRGNSSVEE